MDKTDRLRDYGLAFLLYEQGLGLCGYELIRELFIFVKLILNSYLGFFDHYDFDSKPWGERSVKNELITRAVETVSPSEAKDFKIRYGYSKR